MPISLEFRIEESVGDLHSHIGADKVAIWGHAGISGDVMGLEVVCDGLDRGREWRHHSIDLSQSEVLPIVKGIWI